MITITLDTNILNETSLAKIKECSKGLGFNFATTTVTRREQNDAEKSDFEIILESGVWDESEWDNSVWGEDVNESLVLGESRLGSAKLVGENTLEELLSIISSGGFPKIGNRDNLTIGQKHLLRDAMILETHIREGRNILVSNDKKAYIGHEEKRKILENKFNTKIMTLEEFEKYCAKLKIQNEDN